MRKAFICLLFPRFMPAKMHPKQWRYVPIGKERNRKSRFKTFLDETKAKEYAEKLKLKNFKVVKTNFGLGRKFKIVLE